MIFSKETCPICSGELADSLPHQDPVYTFVNTRFYCCKSTVTVRDHTNTHNIWHTHYCYSEFYHPEHPNIAYSQHVELIYPPFRINYNPSNNLMSINLMIPCNSDRFLFRAPLLKVDFSNSKKVINKLKLLNLLS